MSNFFSDMWNDLTGKTTAKEQTKALEQSQAAINTQQAWERQQQERMNAFQDMLFGMGREKLFGLSPGGPAYMPMAENWIGKYLDFLSTAPDTEYEAGRSAIERGASTAGKQAARSMTSRGLGRSGLAAIPFGQIQSAKSSALADLGVQRERSKGERLSQGSQLTQDLMTKFLNLTMAAAGMPQMTHTQVPGMMQDQARLMAGMSGGGANSPLMQMGQSLASMLFNQFSRGKTSSAQANPYIGTMAQIPSMVDKGLGLLSFFM